MNTVVPLCVFTLFTLSLSAQTPLVNHGDSWRYHKGNAGAPQADWKTAADGGLAGSWLTGNGGIGYADNANETMLCQTLLNDMINTYSVVQMRREFTVSTPIDSALTLQLTMDYDDGFIAWLDGVFLVSANSPNSPNEPANGAFAPVTHESSRGNNGNAATVYPLGAVGSRLAVGTHVLAIVGINQSLGSSDLIQVADLAAVEGTAGGISGPITTDTTWRLVDSPINVVGDVTVNSGVTLTIEPGVEVRLAQGVDLAISGRVLAEGTAVARIIFTRPPAGTTWGGITINGSASSPETRIAYATFRFNNTTAIHSSGGSLALDHVNFEATAHQYVSLDGSSFVVTDCIFPSATALFENVHGTGGIRASGHGVFARNFFGTANSVAGNYNDVLDFTGGNRPSQPIIQFFNNVFIGSDDDLLDLDGTDAWIEGNIFVHAHKNGSPDSSSAISGGLDGSRTSEITIIGNLIYDCDQAATGKEGNFYTLINNTIVHITNQGGVDTASGVVNVADEGTQEGRGMYLEGNIIVDASALTRNVTSATITYSNNFMTLPWSGAGGGNSNADPMLKHIPTLAETVFATWQEAQIMRDWFSLLPGSPALGAGPNGRDAGGVIPLGASISGEPTGTTSETTATLTVGVNRTGNAIPTAGFPNGSGFTHYMWRLDAGAWSAETAIATPISLSGLTDGPHHVEVIGKNDAGLYQNDPLLGSDAVVTLSRTWTVQSVVQPVLEFVSYSPASVTLRFVAQAGATYSVLKRDALDAAHPWTKLTDVPAQGSTGPFTIMDDMPSASARFYELVTPAQ